MVSYSFGISKLECGLFQHWEGVKQYVSKKFNIDLDKTIERHDKVVQWAEGKMEAENFKPGEQLEAASLAERGLGRLIGIVSEIDKKQQGEDRQDELATRFERSMKEVAASIVPKNENSD